MWSFDSQAWSQLGGVYREGFRWSQLSVEFNLENEERVQGNILTIALWMTAATTWVLLKCDKHSQLCHCVLFSFTDFVTFKLGEATPAWHSPGPHAHFYFTADSILLKRSSSLSGMTPSVADLGVKQEWSFHSTAYLRLDSCKELLQVIPTWLATFVPTKGCVLLHRKWT